MNLRIAGKILSQVSFREKVLLVLEATLAGLYAAIPLETRHLLWLLRDLMRDGAEITKAGSKNLIQTCGKGSIRYKFLLRRGTSDAIVARQVFIEGNYGPLIRLISEKMDVTEVRSIVDAGANVGYATIYLLAHLPKAQCHPIEPDPDNFLALQENVRINSFRNVFPKNAALWGANEKVALSRDFRDGRDWSVHAKQAQQMDASGLISGLTVAEIMNELQLPEIDVLKVDIEGAEVEVFSSDAAVKEFLPRVKFLAMEIHPETGRTVEILQLLKDNQFEMSFSGESYIGFNRKYFPDPLK